MWWLKMASRSSRWSFTDLCVLIKYRVQFRSKRYTNGWSIPNRAHQHFSLLPVSSERSVLAYLLQAWGFLSFRSQWLQPNFHSTVLKRWSFTEFTWGRNFLQKNEITKSLCLISSFQTLAQIQMFSFLI